jgi:hypothetical protein
MVSKQTTPPHHHGSGLHDHPVPPVKPKPSPREKLIIRLERFLQHNLEHADMLARWAEEAESWGDLPTAKLVHTAEASFFALNKPLEKAIVRLKNEACDTDPKKSRSMIPKMSSVPDRLLPGATGAKKRKC